MTENKSNTKPTIGHEMISTIIVVFFEILIGIVFMRLGELPWPILIFFILLISLTWIWHKKGKEFIKYIRIPKMIINIGVWLIFFIFIFLVLFFSPVRSMVSGSPRLKGIFTGTPVPISDFSWCTNGSVIATPMEEADGDAVMKVEMTLRGDKPCADAGWGMDLLGWNWLKLSYIHKPWFSGKKEVSFYIRGENGGEKIGISMKSDREFKGPSGAASDEEKVPLDSLGFSIDKNWKQLRIPLHRFYNVDRRKVRNITFYTNSSLMVSVGDIQVIYLKRITFL